MKSKFPKLRMIWAIIRGRSVVYKVEFIAGMSPRLKTDKACVVNCYFVGMHIRDKDNKEI